MYMCCATTGFSVEYRYLPLPTYRTLKVLHLAKRESPDSQRQSTWRIQHISDFTQQDYQVYNLLLKCMLVCCGRPYLVVIR